jgi:hypothetical protein
VRRLHSHSGAHCRLEEDFYRNDYPEGEEDSSEPPDDDPFDGADDDDSD